MQRLRTDVLILGSGGAGLVAALHVHRAKPELSIAIASKGLLGKSGCTRMVQGGYNAAVAPGDSVERHFMDTIEGSGWLADQELAWCLVEGAQEGLAELENDFGCFFDRSSDGTLHLKPFAGQTFDRTVHKGDLTGIEIMNRLAEQVWARPVRRLEEHRAVDLVTSRTGDAIAGAILIDMRRGDFLFVQARAVLLATGGGPTMYRHHTQSMEKSCDGLAMTLRAGLRLRDMEMIQFHPTGLLAGPNTLITGTILEEGLRGAGGHLLGGDRNRFMDAYDPRGERATRDIVSRAMFAEIRRGNCTPNGGLYLRMSHLGPDLVRELFKGMVERCADFGFDLAEGLVEVAPSAHYMMGGVVFTPNCETEIEGLFGAGEDTGGVHGANRLGGNGVADSIVFGGRAGDSMRVWLKRQQGFREPDPDVIQEVEAGSRRPFDLRRGDLNAVRDRLTQIMWNEVGVIRQAEELHGAVAALSDLDMALDETGLPDQAPEFNLAWHEWLDLKNLVLVSRAVTGAAIERENSRGAHYREDFPDPGDVGRSVYTIVRQTGDGLEVTTAPVLFTKVRPGESLVSDDRPKPATGENVR